MDGSPWVSDARTPLSGNLPRHLKGNRMDLLYLWLPILLSAIAIWFISTIGTMALPHHKHDWINLPDPPAGEDAFMDDLLKRGITPGNYLFPDLRGREAIKSPKVEKALKQGPVGHLSIWKTPVTMGDKMLGAFIVHLIVAILIAYLTRLALPGPAPFAKVFQFAATAGILAYSFSFIPSALWFGAYKRTIIASIIDGIVFGLVIGAIFAWRWPHT